MDRPNHNASFVGKTTSLLILIYVVNITTTLALARWITYNNPDKLSLTAVLITLFILVTLSIVAMAVIYWFRDNEAYFSWTRNDAIRTGFLNIHLQTFGIHLFGIGSIALGIAKIVDNIQCYSYAPVTYTLIFQIASCIFFLLEMQFLRKMHGARCNSATLRWFLLLLLATNISVWFYTLMQESEEIFTGGKRTSGIWNQETNEKNDKFRLECLLGNTSLDRYIEDNMNPYLYPFVMEFCLLAASEICAIWWVMTDVPSEMEQNRYFLFYDNLETERYPNNMNNETTPLTNFQRREKFRHLFYVGLFFAIVLISFESIMYIDEVNEYMILVFYISRLVYNIFLMVTSIIGCALIRNVPSRRTNFTSNDIMLLISVVGECLYLLFGVIACIGVLQDRRHTSGTSQLQLTLNLVTLVEVFAQTRLLTRGSRLDLSDHDIVRKYLQEILGYLAVCDFGSWIANSFIEGKLLHNDMVSPTSTTYYGGNGHNWLLITKITYPFYIFYRLHTFVMSFEIASTLGHSNP